MPLCFYLVDRVLHLLTYNISSFGAQRFAICRHAADGDDVRRALERTELCKHCVRREHYFAAHAFKQGRVPLLRTCAHKQRFQSDPFVYTLPHKRRAFRQKQAGRSPLLCALQGCVPFYERICGACKSFPLHCCTYLPLQNLQALYTAPVKKSKVFVKALHFSGFFHPYQLIFKLCS